MKTIVLAGGCFWGVEELFRHQPGVIDTEVGYIGGENSHPTYENHPGHAEALKVSYNPLETTQEALLNYFYTIHDPTTLNQQGNDRGSSYRSALFYENNEQKEAFLQTIRENQAFWQHPIVTTLEPLTEFWPAEPYHQDYLQKNPQGYTCHFERTRP